jgi:proline iminopeptidase
MCRQILLLILFLCTLANAHESKEVFASVKEAKLFCRILGKGKPLVVIHGGPGLSQDYLLPQMIRLTENHLVVFYDQRGCGQSTGEINCLTITLETFVQDLETLRQNLGFEKISILGHSWGGFLAMNYAIAYPERIEKLILSNAIPASQEDFALFAQEWMRRLALFKTELAEIHNTPGFSEGNPDLVERLHRIIFRTYCYLPEKANLLSLRMAPATSVNGSKVYDQFRKNVFEKPFNLYPDLKLLKVPTLVIHGDSDPIPFITAEHVHEVISHSKYILMKNCGHFPYVEDPVVYFKHIEEFL